MCGRKMEEKSLVFKGIYLVDHLIIGRFQQMCVDSECCRYVFMPQSFTDSYYIHTVID